MNSLSRLGAKGRIAVVTRREAGMRWTGTCLLTSGTSADGEVVWSWRPERSGAKLPTMLAHRGDDGGKRKGSPGRAPISCKPSRREGRLSPPVP